MKASPRLFSHFHGRALAVLVSLISALVAAGAASAHEVRFVASYGDNANACTRDAPCLTLQRGISSTPDGGELIILDSGDIGNNGLIQQSITISAIGVSATFGMGITINNAAAVVVLRGLRLNGVNASAGVNGIRIDAAQKVSIQDCEVQGFPRDGILATNVADLFVSGTVSRNNAEVGLRFSGIAARLVVDNSRFENNGRDGLTLATGLGEALITRTVTSSNSSRGIYNVAGKANVSESTSEHNRDAGYRVSSGQMTVERSVARGNAIGLHVEDSSTARLSDSVMTNNSTGLSVEAGSTLLTRRNNAVSGNTTDVSGTLTALTGM